MARRRPVPPSGGERGAQPILVEIPPCELWRIHAGKYGPAQFHPGRSGNARFSPITNRHRRPVPTLYGATTFSAALMETVLHDVPTPPHDFILDLARLEEEVMCVSVIQARRSLFLIDLSTKGLQRLGLRRRDLIDTPVRAYPLTRDWAAWFHQASPKAQGLIWTSRKDDNAKAVMLFGDRIRANNFRVIKAAQPLVGEWLDALLDVALHIGITQVMSPHR